MPRPSHLSMCGLENRFDQCFYLCEVAYSGIGTRHRTEYRPAIIAAFCFMIRCGLGVKAAMTG